MVEFIVYLLSKEAWAQITSKAQQQSVVPDWKHADHPGTADAKHSQSHSCRCDPFRPSINAPAKNRCCNKSQSKNSKGNPAKSSPNMFCSIKEQYQTRGTRIATSPSQRTSRQQKGWVNTGGASSTTLSAWPCLVVNICQPPALVLIVSLCFLLLDTWWTRTEIDMHVRRQRCCCSVLTSSVLSYP